MNKKVIFNITLKFCNVFKERINDNSRSTLSVYKKMRWLLKSSFDQSHVMVILKTTLFFYGHLMDT